MELFLKCSDSIHFKSFDNSPNVVFLVVVHHLTDGDEAGCIQSPFELFHSGDIKMFELVAELTSFCVPFHVDNIDESRFAALKGHVGTEAGEHVPVVVLRAVHLAQLIDIITI